MNGVSKEHFEFIGISIGAVVGLATIYTFPAEIQFYSSSILLFLILAIMTHRIYPKLKLRAAIVPDANKVNNYFIRYATMDDLHDICNLQKEAYSSSDAVPYQLYKEWFEANPDGFFVLEVSGTTNQLVGQLTLLSICEERLNLYRQGKIRETEIRGCDLVSADKRSEITNVYVESLIIKKTHRKNGVPLLYRMMKSMMLAFCDRNTAQIVYAMAATDEGEKTVKGMGFTLVSPKGDRSDSHNMYASDFNDFMDVAEEKEAQFESNMLHRKPARGLQRLNM